MNSTKSGRLKFKSLIFYWRQFFVLILTFRSMNPRKNVHSTTVITRSDRAANIRQTAIMINVRTSHWASLLSVVSSWVQFTRIMSTNPLDVPVRSFSFGSHPYIAQFRILIDVQCVRISETKQRIQYLVRFWLPRNFEPTHVCSKRLATAYSGVWSVRFKLNTNVISFNV